MCFQTFAALCILVTQSAAAYDVPLACGSGIMTTPTYGTNGGLFSVCSNRTIDATPSEIYEVLTDFSTYKDWNSFVYAVDLPPNVTTAKEAYVGMEMTFHNSGLIPPFNVTSAELVTFLEPNNNPPFVSWRYNVPILVPYLMRDEHVSALYDSGNGTTFYLSWETYYEVAAVLTAALKANLQTEFVKQGDDLEKRVLCLKGE